MIRLKSLIETARTLLPGIIVSAALAAASSFLSEHRGGPALLYALLIGMAFFFLSRNTVATPGIHFTARTILRLAVALLGVKISAGQIMELGPVPVAIVISSVLATMVFGRLISGPLGLTLSQGLLGSGAVAICGASAAIAIAGVLPKSATSERDTLFTVISVTILSTTAMVLYPSIIELLHMQHDVAGILLGATIHDVAQVVGAGNLISDQTGVIATYIKLLRVAMLLPLVAVFGIAFRGATVTGTKPPLLPGFLVGFLALAAANSLGLVPALAAGVMGDVSRWCLVSAIAALGMKTSLQDLAELGWRPLALMVSTTLFLLALVLVEMKIAGLV